ncbi:MAG: ssDNA-binding domain-containing protein [Oscillospiraceae bacterium]|jgi:hypothetical protein|nr:ssDNA-binding domain-containing protein [Oscillospiraceae bacterium]
MEKKSSAERNTERAEKVKALTEKLEKGVTDLFSSEKYQNYLKTMSKFHNYSPRNTLLIILQNPQASQVAGFNSWKKNFQRTVKKGEKGIQILAPCPFKVYTEPVPPALKKLMNWVML